MDAVFHAQTFLVIPMLHESHHMPGDVHLIALAQYAQGYLHGLGPGLGSGA